MALKDSIAKIEVKDNKIEFENLLFFILDSNSSLNIDHLMVYDAIIIDAKDAEFTRLIIKKIRAHYNPEYYLKPIFLINYKETKDPILSNLHDGIICIPVICVRLNRMLIYIQLLDIPILKFQ